MNEPVTCFDGTEVDFTRTMLVDRHTLMRRWRQLQPRPARRGDPATDLHADAMGTPLRGATAPNTEAWRAWRAAYDASCERCAARQRAVPTLCYDAELPIAARRDEIAAAIAAHQVVVVCGETGSGKSTQLPKICLELGRGVAGMIGHTQPRRIAARSIAARVADELGSSVGSLVGYKVRFQDATQPETLVKVMTDGVLLAETRHDRFLNQYDTLIIDEAHERSLNIDFLLGLLATLLRRRPDLKLIITSATIDAARFAEHFARHLSRRPPGTPADDGPELPPVEVPVLAIEGRTYPVEVRYRPPVADADQLEPDMPRAVAQALGELRELPRGDVLVFLPTEQAIHETVQMLRRSSVVPNDTELLPLYARLSVREQQRVFQPHAQPRIVLATNVAESSLTVPGIRYVIDTGLARISHFSSKTKVQRLPVEPISRASAQQRAGRCGRIGPGVCIRLYSEEDFLERDEYTTPEIRRTNLAAAILQAKALGLGPLESLPLLDPPHADTVRDGYQTLFELGALDPQRQLTSIGQALARLPVDPRIARMILASIEEGCLNEMLIIAAALEVQDPRERPADQREAADAAHRMRSDGRSDFLAQLRLWEFYQQKKAELTRSQLRKECQRQFLSYNRMREWSDIHRQLLQLVRQHLRPADQPAQPKTENQHYAALHRSILTGLLSGVAYRSDVHEYRGASGLKLQLWPGSGPYSQKPAWIVAAEFVETSRRFARTVARIDPRWIEMLAEHLIEREYSDPQWYRAAGAALVTERLQLFGMNITKRRVRLGMIDPVMARDLFIRGGLVGGDADINAGFFRHNQQLRDELARQASRMRRPELVVTARVCRDFYESRVPPEVYDIATLHHWRRQVERQTPRLLYMTREDLVGDVPESSCDESGFPAQLAVRELDLPVEYRFEPGLDDDGVTLIVPRDALAQVTPDRVDWIVPGMLVEKVERLIRSLPKSSRRELPSTADTARRVVERLRYGQGPFLPAVAAALSDVTNHTITAEQFQLDKLPHYLFMNVHVVNERGQVIARGRDVRRLRERLGVRPAPVREIIEPGWHSSGHVSWDWEELPDEIVIERGGIGLPAFPTLVDRGNSVALQLLDSRDEALHRLRGGVRRLCYLWARAAIGEHLEWILPLPKWQEAMSDRFPVQQFREALGLLIVDHAFLADDVLPRNYDDFVQHLLVGQSRLEASVVEVVRVVGAWVESYGPLRQLLESFPKNCDLEAVVDVRRQVARLLHRDFMTETPWRWLEQYPRYLRAATMRLERLSGNTARDREVSADLQHRERQADAREASHRAAGRRDPELATFRWMLEEYRISLFAQTLGTSLVISPQRLDRQWERVGG